MYISRLFAIMALIFIITGPSTILAQSTNIDYTKGTVLENSEYTNPNTINPNIIRMVSVSTANGTIQAENELGTLTPGDKVVIRSELVPSDDETGTQKVYSIYERDRTIPLLVLGTGFAVAVLLLGFRQGLRSLSALAGTLFVIFGIYIPSLLAGFSPVITSIVLGLLIAGCAVLVTHGFKRTTYVAYASTLLSVLVAVAIAKITIVASGLTGVTSDEVVFLASTSAHALDLAGIMIGGVIITMLGILDDIAITQVAVVEELKKSKPHATDRELYASALRVGRDHAGALVNTLVLAYAGTSLPLLLLLQSQDINFLITINQEQFAFEIIRSLAGSIGLIACVPIATLLAVRFVRPCTHNHKTDGCPHCMTKLKTSK